MTVTDRGGFARTWSGCTAVLAAVLVALTVVWAPAALQAQTAPQAAESGAASGCALTGSESVLIEGRGMLRLSDVTGCPNLRYEIIPHLLINGEPAVRLLPSDECATSGAESVLADGAPLGTVGDAGCAPQG